MAEDAHDIETHPRNRPPQTGFPAIHHEQTARRFANRCYYTGWATVSTTIIGILTAWIASDGHIEINATNRLFTELVLLGLLGVGATLVGVGAVDRLFRPTRTLVRHLLEEVCENRRQIVDLCQQLQDVPDRLVAMEAAIDRVPAYGQGVIDGAQLRADALGPEIR